MVSPFTSHPDKHSIYRTDGYFARLDRCCRFFRQQSAFFSANVYIGLLVGFLVSFTALGQTLSTVAGNGIQGFGGDGGPATDAEVYNIRRVAVDAVGNIFFTDQNRIRKVSTDGTISAVAGMALQGGYSGDGGPATNARLSLPKSVAVDAGGNLYIADFSAHNVRRVSSNGIITTVAGTLTPGATYRDGALATTVPLGNPDYVTFDREGNLLIADVGLNKVFRVTSNGIITTVAGNGSAGFSGDGGPSTAASLNRPSAMIVDAEGNILIADAYNTCIRKVSTDGIISTIAGIPLSAGYSGDGGPATSAKFGRAFDIALDAAGNLLIADTNNQRIRQISTDGTIKTIIGNGTSGFTADGELAANARISYPYGLAFDAAGNLLFSDYLNYRIRRVSNAAPTDTDGDGVLDGDDAFPLDPTESADTDGDGIGNNADTDDDGDGVLDVDDTFPLDPTETIDTDGDGIGDNADTDDDGDGVLDGDDAFPLDPAESADTDGDGIGNNADTDDDGDGVLDGDDAFPLDPTESVDTDGDGIGNNADTDDDGDGVLDGDDAFPLDPTESADTDGDGIGNNADTDDDGDGVLDGDDAFSLDPTESVDTDGDGIGNNADTDDDGDGVLDGDDAFPLDPTETLDTDGDGIGDNADTDDDGDGVPDGDDAFPLDPTESADTDGDGIGNNADTDDDGDGVLDVDDAFPLDPTETIDTDGDGIGDNADTDDDGDGVPDGDDAFPLDPAESADTDGDGIGNNADTDDDGDGVLDGDDTFPLDPTETIDTDGDGIGNNADTDDDGDGVSDGDDAFPLDPTETLDTDGDGIGDNADSDDDGDGVPDGDDAFPLDPTESVDTDGDGIGNNADPDDDGDGVSDGDDTFPLDPTETIDTDGDGIGDNADTDDDGDGVLDVNDAFPLDPTESADTDGDGIGNNADTDDDGDGVLDGDDAFPLDPTETIDTDGDGIGDNADTDDDGDGVLDGDDAFPLDPTESADTDGDGIGNNADTDDDGDGVLDGDDAFPLDPTESVDTDGDGIGDNADTDDDGDGVPDGDDTFPLDPTESADTDGDGIGNNADTDDDGDGVLDGDDAFPLDPTETIDTDGDGIGDNADTDDDNDGVADNVDNAPLVFNPDQADADGDGIGDVIDLSDPNFLKSYVVIGFQEVSMEANVVHSGSVGVVDAGRKVILDEGTTITAANSFVIAPVLDSKGGSQVTEYKPGQVAISILPAFLAANATCKNKLDIKDNSGLVLLDQSCYDNIKVGKNSQIRFIGNGTVTVKSMKLDDNVSVSFGQNTDLLIEKKLDGGKYLTISNSGYSVRIFDNDDVKIDEGSSVSATIYTQGSLIVTGLKAQTTMTGLFIAKKVSADNNVHWNASSSPVTTSPQARQGVAEAEPEVIRELSMDVYPNPASRLVNVKVEGLRGKATASIYDLTGSIRWKQEVIIEQDALPIDLTNQNLQPGMYLISVYNETQRVTKKLMIVE